MANSIWNFFFGNKGKEKKTLDVEPLAINPLKPRPKIPIKGKLTYKGKSIAETKRIIHKQQAKTSEDFNAKVKECTEWLDENLIYYTTAPYLLVTTVHELDKQYLLALRVALSKQTYSSTLGRIVSEEVENALERNGHKYVLKTGKHKR